ncbi:major facilitator superfamily transporter protein [Neisseria shayeganii 871]|uniref:Major facilitator superfamily transporter protein n=1 Tax=Neisseria shayeganii 871 TaxID=1032488 RepID=G4CKB9_9NEIS|nr:major facilitator superfamily transporter protein [Neisseria shayeganii 871]
MMFFLITWVCIGLKRFFKRVNLRFKLGSYNRCSLDTDAVGIFNFTDCQYKYPALTNQ